MATCDPSELLAAGKCFACLTPAQMDAIELQLLCEILAVGGVVGGAPLAGDFGGAEPPFTPATEGVHSVDTSTGQIWWFWDGTWH